MSKPNRVFIRTYCECGCDCPTCHDGNHTTEVEECVYCQIKWAGKGEYNLDYRKGQGWGLPKEHPGYSKLTRDRINVNGRWYVSEQPLNQIEKG